MTDHLFCCLSVHHFPFLFHCALSMFLGITCSHPLHCYLLIKLPILRPVHLGLFMPFCLRWSPVSACRITGVRLSVGRLSWLADNTSLPSPVMGGARVDFDVSASWVRSLTVLLVICNAFDKWAQSFKDLDKEPEGS